MDGVVKIVLQRMLVDMTLRHRSSTVQRIGARFATGMRFLHAASCGAQRFSAQLSVRRNEIPAGAKPSGLAASVQKTRAKV
jgi:hypothetical protein